MKTFIKIIISAALAFAILISAAAITAVILSGGVSLDESKLLNASCGVEIYDDEGNLIKEVSLFTGGASAKIENIPEKTKNAFIAVEDKRFYSHGGLDYKRVLSAAYKNIKNRAFKEGASTITQQLIKNTHLSGEKTISRKLKEMRLSLAAEKRYSKDEILEMYLNSIYFGHSCFGIAEASRFYFDKDVSDLTVSESAVLSGIIKSPNNYSPLKNKEKCLSRRNFVLEEMFRQGYISENELAKAKEEELPAKSYEEECSSYAAEALSEAEALIGKSAFYGGIKIYTYLDRNLQSRVEALSECSDSDKTYMVGDNSTHGINAFYTTATASLKRLPGSVIKPILVYAPAIEEGLISPATPINDEPINYGGYSPKNFGGKYLGYVSARKALAESVNIPAVKILNEVGIKKACSYAEKAGLNIGEEDMSLALALGGMSRGFTLNELAAAYSAFANGGMYEKFAFVKKVEKQNGQTIYKREINEKRAFSEESSALISDMLLTAVKEGTAKKLNGFNNLCAKTGTCESGGKNTDAYTLSYTLDKTIGVWLGNADNGEIFTTGGGIPCAINGKICDYLYKNSSPKPLKKCGNVVLASLDKEEYDKNHSLVLADDNAPKKETVTEVFSKSFLPRVKSDRFSHPSFLETPTIEYKDNTVYIVLRQREYGTYCINRVDEAGNKRSYIVDSTFKDEGIESGKIYTYTVTPYLNKLSGKAIILPSVSTKEAADNVPRGEDPILNRDWWNE